MTTPAPREVSYQRVSPARGLRDVPLSELWQFRELVYFLVWRDLKVRYKQSIIGATWAVIQPLVTAAIFAVFLGRLGHLPSDGAPYFVFYFSGLVPWAYFSTAVQSAAGSVVEHQRVITRVYFPRIALPLSGVLSGLVDFAISFGVLLVVVVVTTGHLSAALLLAVPSILLGVAVAFGAGLWLAPLYALYRDFRFVVPMVLQVWLFLSPIAYSYHLVPRRWQAIYALNPLTTVVTGVRHAVLGGPAIGVESVLASLGTTLLLLVSGLIFFMRTESILADVV